MWEDGYVTFEIEEEDYNLISNSFANEICAWVTIEVLKSAKERLKQVGSYPGTCFVLEKPKNHPNFEALYINLSPVSETQVSLDCVALGCENMLLSPNDAVSYILNL